MFRQAVWATVRFGPVWMSWLGKAGKAEWAEAWLGTARPRRGRHGADR